MVKKKNGDSVGIILVLISSLSVAFLPNSAKLVFSNGVNASTLLFARAGLGVTLLGLILLVTKNSFSLPRHLIFPSLISGLLALAMIATLYEAIGYINVGLSILILSLNPVLIAVYSHVRGTYFISLRQSFCIFFMIIGLALLVLGDVNKISIYGVLISFISTFCAVLITLISSKSTNKIGSTRTNFYLNLWGLLAMVLVLVFQKNLSVPVSYIGWSGIAVNGLCYVMAWSFFLEGAKRIGVTRAAILTSTDPLYAAIIALFLFNETLVAIQWTGFSLVILALCFFEVFKDKKV
jgi:drug/metabolite transporter (DMT)-like permease